MIRIISIALMKLPVSLVVMILFFVSTNLLSEVLKYESNLDNDQLIHNSIKWNKIRLYNNAKTINKSNNKKILNLRNTAYATYEFSNKISTEQGTISAWVKPLWKKGDNKSHTIFSMQWSGKDNSYLALSQGWWEPAGANRLYFILSNQDYVHCSAPYLLESDVWSLLTITWKKGKKGQCNIYVDGERVARSINDMQILRKSKDSLYIGSDLATSSSNGRGSEFLLRDLSIHDVILKHEYINTYYNNMMKSDSDLQNKKLLWDDVSLQVSKSDEKPILKDVNVETRVVFDEDISWALSKKNTDKILLRIKKAGFNVYIPCIWHGKGVYYPSTVAHVDKRVAKRIANGEDPLSYLIDKAHILGIEVHPWFTVVKREDDFYPEYFDDGVSDRAYNVHLPEFQKFIGDLMLEMVNLYPVDGLNLDYMRTMGVCRSSHCIQDYKNKYNKSLNIDFMTHHLNYEAKTRIQSWQDEAVSEVVKRVSMEARKLRPKIVLSADVHLNPKKRRLEGQDAINWANNNWIDVLYQMDYAKKVDVKKYKNIRQLLTDPNKVFFLFGNYDKFDDVVRPRNPEILNKYIELVRQSWPDTGIAFYLYNMLSDEQIEMFRMGPFRDATITHWALEKK